jgi:hypothetical protein
VRGRVEAGEVAAAVRAAAVRVAAGVQEALAGPAGLAAPAGPAGPRELPEAAVVLRRPASRPADLRWPACFSTSARGARLTVT